MSEGHCSRPFLNQSPAQLDHTPNTLVTQNIARHSSACADKRMYPFAVPPASPGRANNLLSSNDNSAANLSACLQASVGAGLRLPNVSLPPPGHSQPQNTAAMSAAALAHLLSSGGTQPPVPSPVGPGTDASLHIQALGAYSRHIQQNAACLSMLMAVLHGYAQRTSASVVLAQSQLQQHQQQLLQQQQQSRHAHGGGAGSGERAVRSVSESHTGAVVCSQPSPRRRCLSSSDACQVHVAADHEAVSKQRTRWSSASSTGQSDSGINLCSSTESIEAATNPVVAPELTVSLQSPQKPRDPRLRARMQTSCVAASDQSEKESLDSSSVFRDLEAETSLSSSLPPACAWTPKNFPKSRDPRRARYFSSTPVADNNDTPCGVGSHAGDKDGVGDSTGEAARLNSDASVDNQPALLSGLLGAISTATSMQSELDASSSYCGAGMCSNSTIPHAVAIGPAAYAPSVNAEELMSLLSVNDDVHQPNAMDTSFSLSRTDEAGNSSRHALELPAFVDDLSLDIPFLESTELSGKRSPASTLPVDGYESKGIVVVESRNVSAATSAVTLGLNCLSVPFSSKSTSITTTTGSHRGTKLAVRIGSCDQVLPGSRQASPNQSPVKTVGEVSTGFEAGTWAVEACSSRYQSTPHAVASSEYDGSSTHPICSASVSAALSMPNESRGEVRLFGTQETGVAMVTPPCDLRNRDEICSRTFAKTSLGSEPSLPLSSPSAHSVPVECLSAAPVVSLCSPSDGAVALVTACNEALPVGVGHRSGCSPGKLGIPMVSEIGPVTSSTVSSSGHVMCLASPTSLSTHPVSLVSEELVRAEQACPDVAYRDIDCDSGCGVSLGTSEVPFAADLAFKMPSPSESCGVEQSGGDSLGILAAGEKSRDVPPSAPGPSSHGTSVSFPAATVVAGGDHVEQYPSGTASSGNAATGGFASSCITLKKNPDVGSSCQSPLPSPSPPHNGPSSDSGSEATQTTAESDRALPCSSPSLSVDNVASSSSLPVQVSYPSHEANDASSDVLGLEDLQSVAGTAASLCDNEASQGTPSEGSPSSPGQEDDQLDPATIAVPSAPSGMLPSSEEVRNVIPNSEAGTSRPACSNAGLASGRNVFRAVSQQLSDIPFTNAGVVAAGAAESSTKLIVHFKSKAAVADSGRGLSRDNPEMIYSDGEEDEQGILLSESTGQVPQVKHRSSKDGDASANRSLGSEGCPSVIQALGDLESEPGSAWCDDVADISEGKGETVAADCSIRSESPSDGMEYDIAFEDEEGNTGDSKVAGSGSDCTSQSLQPPPPPPPSTVCPLSPAVVDGSEKSDNLRDNSGEELQQANTSVTSVMMSEFSVTAGAMRPALSPLPCSVTMSPDSNDPSPEQVSCDGDAALSCWPVSEMADAVVTIEANGRSAIDNADNSSSSSTSGISRTSSNRSTDTVEESQSAVADGAEGHNAGGARGSDNFEDIVQFPSGSGYSSNSPHKHWSQGKVSGIGGGDNLLTTSRSSSLRRLACHCLKEKVLKCQGRFRCLAVDDRETEVRRCSTREGGRAFRSFWNPVTEIWGLVCRKHAESLRQHQLCCLCGRFCVEGHYVQCIAEPSHRFHQKCLGIQRACPHCLTPWHPPSQSGPTHFLRGRLPLKRPQSPMSDRSSSHDDGGASNHLCRASDSPPCKKRRTPRAGDNMGSPRHESPMRNGAVHTVGSLRSVSVGASAMDGEADDSGTVTPQTDSSAGSETNGLFGDSLVSTSLSYASCLSAMSAASYKLATSLPITPLVGSPHASRAKRTSRISVLSSYTPTDKFLDETAQLTAVLNTMDTTSWNRGVRQSPRQLYQAALRGELEKTLAALVHGVDPNWHNPSCHNRTPVHAAAEGGHSTVLLALQKHLGDLSARDDQGCTPVIVAVMNGHLLAVEFFKECGVDFNHQDKEGKACLHHACEQKSLDMVESLLTVKSLDINLEDGGGWTPLMWVSEANCVQIAEALVKNGASLDAHDKEFNTALHWAAFGGSSHVVSFLMQSGASVNAKTENGDTPLHIAVRNEHDDCVLRLLRLADQFIRNANNEQPVDIADRRSEAYVALKVYETAGRPRATSRRVPLYIRDISKGRERYPVPCFNDVDSEPAPTDFRYVACNVETRIDTSIKRAIATIDSCGCNMASGECCSSARKCKCVERNPRESCWYSKEGLIDLDIFKMKEPVLFECNTLCNCHAACRNRLVQNGTKHHLQLFKTEKMGWGVRTENRIPKGSFVCEYVGELISDDDAEARNNDSYIFDIGLDGSDDMWCVDACHFGNVARFINHSCEPNIKPIRVFAQHQDPRFPHMALFATEEIEPGGQICFDYGSNFWKVKGRQMSCECGTPSCSYYKRRKK